VEAIEATPLKDRGQHVVAAATAGGLFILYDGGDEELYCKNITAAYAGATNTLDGLSQHPA
jgi:hypothetical protein